jgi:hypothetical protein
MLAVYLYALTPKLKFAAIFTLPIILKIVRTVAWAVFSLSTSEKLQGYDFIMNDRQIIWSVMGWMMAAVDNAQVQWVQGFICL